MISLLHVYAVVQADVQQGDLLGVVQRGPLDGRAGQQHRFEVGYGGDGARAADLKVDAQQFGEGLLGLEFIGYGPFRRLGREAQRPLVGIAVHFDDYAVGREGELLARLVPVGDEGIHLLLTAADAHVVRDLESPLARLLQILPVGFVGQAVARQLVERAVQSALRHDGRRLLLERSGGGVARVGEEGFALLLALGVEPVERGVGHQDFAPYLEQVGPPPAAQYQRYAADGPHVGRHVVAAGAVAAGHGTHQPSVFVGERDGRAVELQLADVLRPLGLLLDAGQELVELLQRVGIAQREHREAVFDRTEFGGDVAPDPHGGGVGIGVFGVRLLQILQLAHHPVEVEVRYLGCIVDVVFPVVVVELSAQLFDSLSCLCHK